MFQFLTQLKEEVSIIHCMAQVIEEIWGPFFSLLCPFSNPSPPAPHPHLSLSLLYTLYVSWKWLLFWFWTFCSGFFSFTRTWTSQLGQRWRVFYFHYTAPFGFIDTLHINVQIWLHYPEYFELSHKQLCTVFVLTCQNVFLVYKYEFVYVKKTFVI